MVTITSFWSSRVIDWGAAAARFVLQSSSAKARALIRLHMGLSSRFLVGHFWRVRPGGHGEVPAAAGDQLNSKCYSEMRMVTRIWAGSVDRTVGCSSGLQAPSALRPRANSA